MIMFMMMPMMLVMVMMVANDEVEHLVYDGVHDDHHDLHFHDHRGCSLMIGALRPLSLQLSAIFSVVAVVPVRAFSPPATAAPPLHHKHGVIFAGSKSAGSRRREQRCPSKEGRQARWHKGLSYGIRGFCHELMDGESGKGADWQNGGTWHERGGGEKR